MGVAHWQWKGTGSLSVRGLRFRELQAPIPEEGSLLMERVRMQGDKSTPLSVILTTAMIRSAYTFDHFLCGRHYSKKFKQPIHLILITIL